MSKHDRKLDLLTGIPADLIELCAAQRIKLLAKLQAKTAPVGVAASAGTKKPFFNKKLLTVAIAAVLLLTVGLSAFFLLLGDGKQIPVYLGMTVSSESPAALQAPALSSPLGRFTLYDTLSPEFALLAHKENDLHDNRPNQKLTTTVGATLDPESGAALYYANQREDFFITVHIDNPDKFEILSFTLNGEKYSSYMFEPGSNMENLILKCNVGDASGIVEYTIDAIKYVDGTEIKDVRMEGDQTVKVGVYTEEQPIAIIGTSTIGFSEISFDLSINDPTGILGLLDSEVSVVLYRENTAIDSKSVSIADATAVRFTGLDDGTEYRIAVIASYDAFDGAGKTEHTIGERTVTTSTIVTPQVSGISYTEAVAKLKWHNTVTDKNAVSFALYKGSEKIRDLSGNEVKLTDLLSGADYTLKVEYTQNGKTKSRSVDFQTQKVAAPTLHIVDHTPEPHSICFKLNYNDPLNLIGIDKIELLLDGNVVATATEAELIEFTNLKVPQTYTAQITYSYDLMDGKGTQTKTLSAKLITQSKGLLVENGKVIDIGTCADEIIYINMPIASMAFDGSEITEVVLGSGVTSIDHTAFHGSSLVRITMSDGLTYIGATAFAYCTKLEEIIFPNTLTSIGTSAFAACDSLEEIVLPDSLTSIGSRAFECDNLKYVVIPESVTQIDSTAFWRPSTLSSPCMIYCRAPSRPNGWEKDWCGGNVYGIFNYKETQTDSQGVTYAVLNNGSLIAIDFRDSVQTVVLPDNTIKVAPYTFYSSKLQKITIPAGVTELGEWAFWQCYNLKTVILNEGLTTIADGCFEGDSGITNITLPSTLTTLGKSFSGCDSIKSIVIPEGITEIIDGTFYGCSELSNIILPNTLKTIGGHAFSACNKLRSIILPDSLSSIGDYAFSGTSIRQLIIPASVKKIGEGIVWGNPYNITILCEAASKPSGWDKDWDTVDPSVAYPGECKVVWGYQKKE